MRCEVCGIESKYPLCRKHYAMREQGNVIPCINCGKLHEGANKPYCLNCWKDLQDQEKEESPTPICFKCHSPATKEYHDEYADIFSCSNSRCLNAWEITSPKSNHKNDVEKVLTAIADVEYPLQWDELRSSTYLQPDQLKQVLKRLFQTKRIRKADNEYLLTRTEIVNHEELAR